MERNKEDNLEQESKRTTSRGRLSRKRMSMGRTNGKR